MKSWLLKNPQLNFAFYMTLLMGPSISGIMTLKTQNLNADFVKVWISSFLETYVIVLPTVILVSPVASRLQVYTINKINGGSSK